MSSYLRALAVLAAAAACSCGGSSTSSPTNDPSAPTAPNTITITSNGVSPKAITVSAGAQVTFVNSDPTHDHHNMFSDPHPDHTDCPPINSVGFIVNGQSRQTSNLVTVRVCGYHDHDDAQNTKWQGTITIQ
jgi:plastocyanin